MSVDIMQHEEIKKIVYYCQNKNKTKNNTTQVICI